MLHMRPTGRHMPHHLRLGLLLLLPLLLAACGGGSGTVAHSTLPTATPAPPLPPTAKGVYLSVYDESNANGQTIVSNQAIVALNPADGSVRWRVPAPGNIGNLVTTDRVIYAMIGQTVVALRASDGIQMWSHPLNGDFIYANGVIYGATSDAGSDMTLVVALDGLTGATRWTSQPLLPGSLTLDGSDIIVSKCDPRLTRRSDIRKPLCAGRWLREAAVEAGCERRGHQRRSIARRPALSRPIERLTPRDPAGAGCAPF